MPEINTDMMRSSYINYVYASNDKTMNQKYHLAQTMRHSVITAQKNYLKVDKIPQTEVIKEEDKTKLSTEQEKEDSTTNNNKTLTRLISTINFKHWRGPK